MKCALPNSYLSYIPALDAASWTYLPDPQQSLDMLQDFCQNGAKSLIIPVPDNPTNQIQSDSFIKAARDIMEDQYGFLILVFANKGLWFDDIPDCYSWSPNQYENLISIHSHSKWLSSLEDDLDG